MATSPNERQPKTPSPLRPLLLALIAFTGFLAFQTTELMHERVAIAHMHRTQDQAYAESSKLRMQLNSLAGKTALLAKQGDANAKAIIAAFARQGVNMRPPKSQTATGVR